ITAFGASTGTQSAVGAAVTAVAVQQIPERVLIRFGNLPLDSQEATIRQLLKALDIPLFWIIPVALTSTVAADSFVGEKERDTLEPLLAAPVSNAQLFVAKLAAAVIPAVLGTWFGVALFMVFVTIANSPLYPRFLLSDADWVFSTLVIVPLLALLAATI